MSNYKIILRFFSIFIVTYIFLLLPQTGIDRKYENYFRNLGNKLFNNSSSEEVIFLMEEHKDQYDSRLYLSKKTLKQPGNNFKGTNFPVKARRIGFIATAFLFSLIVATTLSWKRKFFALTIGFILISAFAMVKLRMLILHFYTISIWIGLHQDPSEIKRIDFWNDIFASSNTNAYYFATIVWLALCFSKNDWQKLNGVFIKIAGRQQISKSTTTTAKQPVKSKKVKGPKNQH